MKITFLNNSYKRYNDNKNSLKITFTNNPDSYYDNTHKLEQKQKILLQNNYSIMGLPANQIEKKCQKIIENLNSFTEYSREITAIEEILKASKPEKRSDDEKVIEAFFKGMMDLIKSNKGFNRISGYDAIKSELETSFILKTVLREKTSLGADVPNAYLFFGPTGCGKTTFALALAEQSLCNIEFVIPDSREPEEIMEEIIQKAKKAKDNYEKNDSHQRTIILINEFDTIAYQDSSITQQLVDFIRTCADKYKCTLFLTTNYPLDIDEQILSEEIIPTKIAVPSADYETANRIITDYLAKKNKPIITTDKILNKLFSQKAQYSNRDIIDILDLAFLENEFPEEEDYIAEIERGKITPRLTPQVLNEFEENKNYFNLS